jgi:exopolyphosphatase / guanosine-5'-triphosphate,3'-diphosphate pyrophosphatase
VNASTLPQAQASLASIDIGSNSFRLEIGRVLGGRYRRLEYFKETVRLGAGLDEQRRLTEAAAKKGLDCLSEFSRRLQGFDHKQVRAVATQTLREAANRDEFLVRAQEALGYPIEVLSGREEARLIYAGVAHLQPSESPRLVIDIGGRSTELILGKGKTPLAAESFPVGSVSLSMRFFAEGRLTPDAFRSAQIAAGAEFEEALDEFSPSKWTEALGSSGTVGAVSHLLLQSGVTDGSITASALVWLMDECIKAGHVDQLVFPGLKEDRRAVLPGGLCILYTLVTHFGISVLQPAKGALRQGVIVDLHERLTPSRGKRGGDLREETVTAMQIRFGLDMLQAQRVRKVALSLYDSVTLDDDDQARRELAWACDLHEIGMALSHHDHHRHSAYILSHIDAPGFSQSQQRRLGLLVLAQRGGLRKIDDHLHDLRLAWMILCLRLAVIRCHAREADLQPQLTLMRRNAQQALVGWHPARLALSPRTHYLLREEAQTWSRVGPISLDIADE